MPALHQCRQRCNAAMPRTEHDYLGSLELPSDHLTGIHSQRAQVNFDAAQRPVRPELIHAYALVKQACCRVNARLGALSEPLAQGLEQACMELSRGELDAHVLVDALAGGAGTSVNMNVNEVLANRCLQLQGYEPGDYQHCDPLDHVNRHQSTNDTFPTALRVAGLFALRRLEQALVALLEACQEQEKQLSDVVKVGRTQLQDAVLMTLGREFGAFADCLARDRWRVHKCEERLRVVGLGGTAIGTGLGAPRQFIFQVVDELRVITNLPLARAENLVDATANQDAIVEVSGILSALASNILKIAGDLRLLASGPEAGLGDIRLPARQAGSSIMPGKINPVIPEAAQQVALRVLASHGCIAQACGMGDLQINQFMPLIADELLGSIGMLERACRMLAERCVRGLEADPLRCRRGVEGSTALLTALVDRLGYQAVSRLAATVQPGQSVRAAVLAAGLLSEAELDDCLSPEAVNRLGSRPEVRP